uniref:OFD1 centriole and centriolar satellite protein n=1 Tax=Dicentrarchus labrax TaxID=13489 RepID=A0A8C4IQY7_DICLA
MSSAKEDTLSPDELRKRLYQTFKNKGVLDTLKTQLRNQLIQELKHPPLTGGEPVPRPVPVKSEPLLVSACNSIVADHLRTSGYEYTLSVFYPESGLCKDKVSTKGELLQLLRISPESALFRSLVIKNKIQLVEYFEKMKLIDKEYESFTYSGDKWFSFQSKLAAYRKEMEAQMQEEMNTKMQHFKDVEIAKVRMEEQAKFHKEFDKLKHELERTYEMKAKALMDREKNAIDRLQKQQEIEEKNLYMQRQSVLKEIETLRNRENELRMRMEAFEKTCQIHEEKVKTMEDLLRRRELAVKTMEDTYDQRLKNELSRYQLELKEEFIRRTENLTENENRNKMETARIQKESAVINGKLEEHSRACSELRRLQVELDTAQQQISLLTQQKELLRERLESVSDYPSLKREKAELQGKLRLLKTQLEEAQEENQLLHADLGKPSKEQLALQMELRKLQNARRLDEEEFDNHKQVLQAQLQSEVTFFFLFVLSWWLVFCISVQLSSCLLFPFSPLSLFFCVIHAMMAALENEVLRNPKPSLVDRSVLELSTDKLVPPDIYVDRALLRARVGYDDVCEAGGPSRGHKAPWSDSPDSDMEMVAEAKARIQELQKEAETLEEAYRNYQQRAVRATVSHMLPPRAHPSHRPDSPQRKQISHHSHTHSPHKSKVSHRPLSPQTRTPSLAPYDTRNTVPPAQLRVTFSDDHNQPQSTAFTDHSLHSFTESLFLRDGQPQGGSSPPPRRLSSTPHSSSRKKLQREISEGTSKNAFSRIYW